MKWIRNFRKAKTVLKNSLLKKNQTKGVFKRLSYSRTMPWMPSPSCLAESWRSPWEETRHDGDILCCQITKPEKVPLTAYKFGTVCVCVQSLSRVPLFWDPMDCSPPGFSVHGILQARILEWVAISSSSRSSWLRDRTHTSCTGRRILYHWASWEAHWYCVHIF